MREIRTEIDIEATPDAVWATLVDFAAFEQWNPFISNASGTLREGERLKVTLAPPGKRGFRFTPVVVAADPGKRLVWRGTLGFKGLFDGEHQFELEGLPEGRTRFIHSERFTGVLVPLLAGTLGDARKGFVAMNEALKRRVEGHAPQHEKR
jgi:hypothetical protein